MTEDPSVIVRPARTVELDFARFNRLAAARGWLVDGTYDYDRIAEALAMSERQTYRVLDRECRPSGLFIGGLLTAVDELRFRGAFRLVNAADPIGED